MVVTGPWFNFLDDETTIINAAAQPIRETIRMFGGGTGQHEHPPLSDILLHFWLKITGGRITLLRLPSIALFLAGLFVLAQAAYGLAGPAGCISLVIISALWPFGFHFGRLTGWYAPAFFLVALLTWCHLKCAQSPTRTWRVLLIVAAVALVYTNYFGWTIIACVWLDMWLRGQRKFALLSGAVTAAAYAPLWIVFMREIHSGITPGLSLLNASFNFYSLFVSESVAPWFWRLSFPAGAAIVAACVITLRVPAARPMFMRFLALFLAMSVSGIVGTKRLLLIAPWMLLPLAIATAKSEGRVRMWLAGSLIVIIGLGWIGIVSRRFYAAQHFIEPWPAVANEAAKEIRAGALVIGNNNSFFFYLTYALGAQLRNANWRFTGMLPNAFKHDQVLDPAMWAATGFEARPTTLLITGPDYSFQELTHQAEQKLDRTCSIEEVQRLDPDSGFRLKQHYFPGGGQVPWRVQIRRYSCPQTTVDLGTILHR